MCGIEVYLPEVQEESGKIQMLSSKLDIIRQLKLEINLLSLTESKYRFLMLQNILVSAKLSKYLF